MVISPEESRDESIIQTSDIPPHIGVEKQNRPRLPVVHDHEEIETDPRILHRDAESLGQRTPQQHGQDHRHLDPAVDEAGGEGEVGAVEEEEVVQDLVDGRADEGEGGAADGKDGEVGGEVGEVVAGVEFVKCVVF